MSKKIAMKRFRAQYTKAVLKGENKVEQKIDEEE